MRNRDRVQSFERRLPGRSDLRPAAWTIVILSLCALLAGCGATHPIKYYGIDLPTSRASSGKTYNVRLLVAHISSPQTLRDGRILYRVGTHEIGVYEYHRWVEPPDRMIYDSLVRLLRSSGKYQSVEELRSSTNGDYIVRGKLHEFSEVDNPEIRTRVSMEIELYDRKDGRTVWSHFYTHEDPVDGKDIQDVVQSLDRNLQRGLQETITGLDQYFAGRAVASPESRMRISSDNDGTCENNDGPHARQRARFAGCARPGSICGREAPN